MNTRNLGHTSALYIWNGLCVFWGTSFSTDPHAHNTLQLVFDIEKKFLIKDEASDWMEYSAVIIEANHVHQLDSNNSIQLYLYLDVESRYAKLLREKYLQHRPIQGLKKLEVQKSNGNFLKQLLVQNNCDEIFKGCISIFQELLDLEEHKPIDKRVEKAIDYIVKSPVKNFKVREVALEVGLSESRLRHLFKEHIGQSIQNFIKWMRVIDSLNHVLKGKKLLNAAYDYGFSDASHMTKSFVEIIGVPPSQIKAYEKETRIIPCKNSNHFSLSTTIIGGLGNSKIVKKINQ